MTRNSTRRLAGALALLLPFAAAAAPRYDLEVISAPGGGSSLTINAINDRGDIVGSYVSGGVEKPFARWSGGGIVPLPVGGLAGSVEATDINNQREVVGSSYDDAVWWSPNGGHYILPGGPGSASAINEGNEVVGDSKYTGGGGVFVATIWRNGSRQFLGSSNSYAYDINDHGEVVGWSSAGSGYHAFRRAGSLMQDLGTLGGSYSIATAINNNGWVVGKSTTSPSSPDAHAVLWRPGESILDLGTLGGNASVARDVNDAGQVVGRADGRAFLWNGGRMTDLDALVGSVDLTWARAVNEHAQIAGAANCSSFCDGFVLTLHPDWVGSDGWWDDWSGQHWDWAGTGTAAARVGEMHDVVIDPGVSATVRGSSEGRARSLLLGGTPGVVAALDLNGGTTTVLAGTMVGPGGRLMGGGRHEGGVTLKSGGELLVGTGQAMQLSGNLTQTGGRVRVLSTSSGNPAILEVTGKLISDGQIDLRNAWLDAAGGIANASANAGARMSLYGKVDVSGDVQLLSGNRLEVSGPAGEAVFWDPFRNDGEVVVTSGSTATFFGLVTGTGSFTGAGTKHFAGGLNPGHSPGLMTMGGDIRFLGGDLIMELGGTTPGTGHDKIVFTSDSSVTIDGTALLVEWWGGFTADAGDIFDLFDWNGVLTGTFGSVSLPALDPGLLWDTSDLYAGGTLKVSAVPLPASSWLALSALTLLGWLGKRRRSGLPAH